MGRGRRGTHQAEATAFRPTQCVCLAIMATGLVLILALIPIPCTRPGLVTLLKQVPVSSVHRFATAGGAAACPGYAALLAVGAHMSVMLAGKSKDNAQGSTLVVRRVELNVFEVTIKGL